jgi:acetoin utilization protein AcuB
MKLVRDLMQKEVATLHVNDHLDLANDIMGLGRIRHMPVLEGDKVVGMVSQRDLLRAGISSVLRFRPASEREWLAKIAVREVMVKPVVTVGSSEPLRQAVDLMMRKKIGCLPVVDDDKLVGLLSETDLLAYLEALIDRDDAQAASG